MQGSGQQHLQKAASTRVLMAPGLCKRFDLVGRVESTGRYVTVTVGANAPPDSGHVTGPKPAPVRSIKMLPEKKRPR
jgi:hypothetical protein